MAGATHPDPLHAFSSPSPPPTSAPSPDDLPSWHFPGPSSVFHKREKDATRHRRLGSHTTPVAPTLTTERRASHRRAKSSAAFAAALSPLPSTPGASEKGRSPLGRFPSYPSPAMPAPGPLTPAKSIASSRPGSKLQDSPFSDYFTDDGRSSNGDGYTAPSPEAQQMLLRLSRLQSHLMRGVDGESEREALSIVGQSLDGIERGLGSLHSQTRMPPDLEDSGLFLEEDEGMQDDEKDQCPTSNGLGMRDDRANDVFDEPPTPEQKQAESDYLIVQAQQLLSHVTKAQEQLRQRHAELRELNDAHMAAMEEKDRLIEELQSENAGMQLDLNHDHSELLFLKLQLKSLEMEFDALDDGTPTTARPKPAKRKKLREDMDRWGRDWDNVDGRMSRRRSQYGIASPLTRRDSPAELETEEREADDGWKLQTVKTGEGRVQSIVIRRTTSAGYPFGLDGADKSEDEEVIPATKSAASTSEAHSPPQPAYAERSTQTESLPPSWLFGEGDRHERTPSLDDCAITTSSEAGETEYGDVVVEEKTPTVPVKSAWQDLWEGLSSLAGASDERFD